MAVKFSARNVRHGPPVLLVQNKAQANAVVAAMDDLERYEVTRDPQAQELAVAVKIAGIVYEARGELATMLREQAENQTQDW